jgi:GNAT superfamily N-acetyltransferase
MPLPDGLHLRAAEADDLPRVAELRETAGWVAQEWALRAVLDPSHARCVVAVDGENHVVGVGSGVAYRPLGMVGNMIVDPAHRRRGIGGAILDAVLEFLDARGSTRLELSATDDGRPLYARAGFTPAEPGISALLPRISAVEDGDGADLSDAAPDALGELAAYDTPRFGGDRSPLLATMLADLERPLVVARQAGAIVGWAWLRPENERVGPLVADTPDIAVALVAAAMRRLPGTNPLRLNMPASNRAGAARLRVLGAALLPWDQRMARGPQVPRREDAMYANAVGALG